MALKQRRRGKSVCSEADPRCRSLESSLADLVWAFEVWGRGHVSPLPTTFQGLPLSPNQRQNPHGRTRLGDAAGQAVPRRAMASALPSAWASPATSWSLGSPRTRSGSLLAPTQRGIWASRQCSRLQVSALSSSFSDVCLVTFLSLKCKLPTAGPCLFCFSAVSLVPRMAPSV